MGLIKGTRAGAAILIMPVGATLRRVRQIELGVCLDDFQAGASLIQAPCGNGRGAYIGAAGDLCGSAGQAPREKQPLHHGRYRHGGVFAVFHAEPVVPGASAALGGGHGHGRSNCETLFGMTQIPSDNHVRDMLDPVEPDASIRHFPDAVDVLEAGGGLTAFRRLGHHVLIAFDGTEYFRSAKLHCPNCSTRKRSGGTIEYFHTLVAATLVAPGHNRVVPLEPEFIVPQDGHDKQDCESMAARRWLAAHGPSYARLNPVYLGDDLYSRQPICQAVRAVGGHFLFVCKPSSHPTIEEYLTGVELPELTKRVKRGRQRSTYTYRWLGDVPLRDGADAMTVNWLMIEIRNAAGKSPIATASSPTCRSTRDNVVELAACGRARWKIENETFNTLKTKGYNLEHNFGHGKQHLAAVLATLNLLAFAFHTVAELARRPLAQAIKSQEPAAASSTPALHHRLPRFSLMAAPPQNPRLRSPATQPP